jgi:lipopolysaccharide transport system permease protein
MQDFSASPQEMVASFWRNRALIYALSRREVIGRYRGSYFGILWSFFNPLLMLAVYTFVFGQIFQSRWSPKSDSIAEFALVLFAGLIIFNIFAECLNQAPRLILNNANYVKKVVFPLEVLPWVSLSSALFHGFVSLCVWILVYSLLFGIPNLTILCLPLIILPFCLMIMGLSWALASLGVYLRDIGQIIGISVSALMFLAPVFYPITLVPSQYRSWLLLNPVTYPIEITREFLFWGLDSNFYLVGLLIYFTITVIVAYFGFFWFQKTRKGFSDVL